MTLWSNEAKVVGPPELTDLKISWATKAEPVSSKQTLKTGEGAPLGREITRLDNKAIYPWSTNVSCLLLVLATF